MDSKHRVAGSLPTPAAKQRDEFAPKAKIGVMGLGRGYALPVYDKMLPKDIPFTDLESGGVWTPTGVPMQDFGNMGDRERTVEPLNGLRFPT